MYTAVRCESRIDSIESHFSTAVAPASATARARPDAARRAMLLALAWHRIEGADFGLPAGSYPPAVCIAVEIASPYPVTREPAPASPGRLTTKCSHLLYFPPPSRPGLPGSRPSDRPSHAAGLAQMHLAPPRARPYYALARSALGPPALPWPCFHVLWGLQPCPSPWSCPLLGLEGARSRRQLALRHAGLALCCRPRTAFTRP